MVRNRLLSCTGGGGGSSTCCGNGRGGAGCFALGGAFSSIGGGVGGACGRVRKATGGAFGSTTSSGIDVSPVISIVLELADLGGAFTSICGVGGALFAAAMCSGPGGLFAIHAFGGAFGLFAGSSGGGGVFVTCCCVVGMNSGGLRISSASGSGAKNGLDSGIVGGLDC